MDLASAIAAHARWNSKLQETIETRKVVDPATIHKSGCELGQWLRGEGRNLYGGKPEFISLLTWHDAFHVESAKVADAITKKKFGEAKQMTTRGTPFSLASNAVNISVNRLKKALLD
jgi:hypothetical protein